MAKRIEKDGKFYRMRRGKLVEIPPEWAGHRSSWCEKRRRGSHFTRKHRMQGEWGNRWKNHPAAAMSIRHQLGSWKDYHWDEIEDGLDEYLEDQEKQEDAVVEAKRP